VSCLENIRQLCRVLRRTGSPVAVWNLGPCGSASCALWYWKTCFEKCFLNEPLHIIVFPQMNHNFILGLSCAFNPVMSPSVGVVGLAEYVRTHPVLTFTVEDPDYIPEDVE
jgi:hypothetical protein